MTEGNLSRRVKETIALLVSMDNGCEYCVAAHSAALRAVGLPPEAVAVIMEDPEKGDFTAKEKGLIGLTRRANRAPRNIPDETFRALRRLGVSDAEIVEALGVVAIDLPLKALAREARSGSATTCPSTSRNVMGSRGRTRTGCCLRALSTR